MTTLHFEWDEPKAQANIAKHGVSFDEAKTVFEPIAMPGSGLGAASALAVERSSRTSSVRSPRSASEASSGETT